MSEQLGGILPGLGARTLRNVSRTLAEVDIFVDPVAGSDSNRGSQTAPVRSLEKVDAMIPHIVDHTVRVHLKPGTYNPTPMRSRVLHRSVYFYADDVWDANVYRQIGAGVAGAGTTLASIDAAFAADSLNGTFIEFLDGAAVGSRRLIRNNTAAAILPAALYRTIAPVPGDAFRLFRSDRIIFDFDVNFAGGGLWTKLTGSPSISVTSSVDLNPPGLIFVGIQFLRTSTEEICLDGGNVSFFGCESNGVRFETFNCALALGAGFAPLGTAPQTSALGVTGVQWYGWGHADKLATPVRTLIGTAGSNIRGYVNGRFITLGNSTSVSSFLNISILGGLLGAPFEAVNGTFATLGVDPTGSLGPVANPVKIDATGATHAVEADDRTAAGPTTVSVAVVNAELSSVNGDCLRTEGGVIVFNGSVTGAPTGTGAAVRARFGGRVRIAQAPVLGGAGTDYDVGNGAPVNKAALAAVGSSLSFFAGAGADGSCIQRVV